MGFRSIITGSSTSLEEQIQAIPLCVEALNNIIWRDTLDGSFATKSAWLGRQAWTHFANDGTLFFSTIVSFFYWRIWQDLIPVDVIWPPMSILF